MYVANDDICVLSMTGKSSIQGFIWSVEELAHPFHPGDVTVLLTEFVLQGCSMDSLRTPTQGPSVGASARTRSHVRIGFHGRPGPACHLFPLRSTCILLHNYPGELPHGLLPLGLILSCLCLTK